MSDYDDWVKGQFEKAINHASSIWMADTSIGGVRYHAVFKIDRWIDYEFDYASGLTITNYEDSSYPEPSEDTFYITLEEFEEEYCPEGYIFENDRIDYEAISLEQALFRTAQIWE